MVHQADGQLVGDAVAVANNRLIGLPLVVGLAGLKSENTVSTSATRRSTLIVRLAMWQLAQPAVVNSVRPVFTSADLSGEMLVAGLK